MKACAHIALGTLFLFVPKLFGVLLFGNIVKVAVVVHNPAAIAAEGVLVPFSFGLLAPFLRVALAETDAVPFVQADADRYRFVIHHECQGFALLHHLDFGGTELQLFRQHL